jgi:hypothetical protein
MMDTMEEAATEAMVNTSMTRDFIDEDFVNQMGLLTCKLIQPIPVYNVDGMPNEVGSINEVVDMVMSYNRHSKCILLAVTQLGKQSMILGFTWLKKHNSEIDFWTRLVNMSRCLPQCCVGCQTEWRDEQKAKKENTKQINTCHTSPLPAFVEDVDDQDDKLQLDPESTPEETTQRRQSDLGHQTPSRTQTYPGILYNFPAACRSLQMKLPTDGL